MCHVTFTCRPPESVISAIDTSGEIVINMPGGYSHAVTSRNPTQHNDSSNDSDNEHDFSPLVIKGRRVVGFDCNDSNNANWKFYSEAIYTGNQYAENDNANIAGILNNMRSGNRVSVSASSSLTSSHNIVSDGGYVKVTLNGVTTTYRGINGNIMNNRVYIDGRAVTASDAVQVNASSASGSGSNPNFSASSSEQTENTSSISNTTMSNCNVRMFGVNQAGSSNFSVGFFQPGAQVNNCTFANCTAEIIEPSSSSSNSSSQGRKFS